MKKLDNLFENNKKWALKVRQSDPGFFEALSKQQSPEYLWIGCADSRVPANQIIDLLPGEIFVHRNVANLVKHTDMNCLSVLQFSVEVLKVKHIIVCGHYGCGGVATAMDDRSHGLIDNWIRSIRDIYLKNQGYLSEFDSREAAIDRLCELNVMDQVYNVCQTTVVQDAWRRNQDLNVHGWIYSIKDGLLKDLEITVSSNEEVSALKQPK